MREGIEIRCWPREDEEFVADVQRAVRRLQSHDGDGATDAVTGELRGRYPNVRIAARSAFGALDGSETVWYVYRDGHPIPHRDDGVGAMRAWNRHEEATRHSVDLLVWSSDALELARLAVASARDARAAAATRRGNPA